MQSLNEFCFGINKNETQSEVISCPIADTKRIMSFICVLQIFTSSAEWIDYIIKHVLGIEQRNTKTVKEITFSTQCH